MSLQLITPCDREPDPVPPGDAPIRRGSHHRRQFADLCFILVKAGAFLGAIYLAVLGLPLMFFLMLTGGDMALLFAHLGNLSAHYLAADHASQAEFAAEIKLALLAVATFAAIWRLPRFLNEVAATLDDEQDAL